jgi:hypothetical protein
METVSGQGEAGSIGHGDKCSKQSRIEHNAILMSNGLHSNMSFVNDVPTG